MESPLLLDVKSAFHTSGTIGTYESLPQLIRSTNVMHLAGYYSVAVADGWNFG